MNRRQGGDKIYRPHTKAEKPDREPYGTRSGGLERSINYTDASCEVSVGGYEEDQSESVLGRLYKEHNERVEMAKQDDITAMLKMMMQMRQDEETRRREDKEREEKRWERERE